MPTELRKHKNAERKERTRSRLLDAAMRVFVRVGYHKAAISDIVAGAGVGQGTFYRHFSSKRDVFEALLDRLLGELIEEFAPMSSRLPVSLAGYRQASLAVVKRLAGVVRANRELVLVFLREGRSIDGRFEKKLTATYDRFADQARFYLDHAIERGFARPCRSDLVSQALVGIALRMVDRWLGGSLGEVAIEEMIEELVDFAFFGFGKPKGEEHG